MLAEPIDDLDTEEYLALERAAETRSEFLGGQVYAMVGASRGHNYVVGDLFALLRAALRGSGCDVYMADLRVRVAPCDAFFYPDLTVVCGKAKFEDEQVDTLTNPTLVIEVLSGSTEAFDRGEKAHCYRQLTSLETLLLVAQNRARIEAYDREESGVWTLREANGLDASIALPRIGEVSLALADVYERARRLW